MLLEIQDGNTVYFNADEKRLFVIDGDDLQEVDEAVIVKGEPSGLPTEFIKKALFEEGLPADVPMTTRGWRGI